MVFLHPRPHPRPIRRFSGAPKKRRLFICNASRRVSTRSNTAHIRRRYLERDDRGVGSGKVNDSREDCRIGVSESGCAKKWGFVWQFQETEGIGKDLVRKTQKQCVFRAQKKKSIDVFVVKYRKSGWIQYLVAGSVMKGDATQTLECRHHHHRKR